MCTISAADYLLPVLMGHFRGNAASLSRSLFFLTGASSEFFTNHLPIVEVKSKSHDVKSVRLSHTLLIAKRVRLVVGWTIFILKALIVRCKSLGFDLECSE